MTTYRDSNMEDVEFREVLIDSWLRAHSSPLARDSLRLSGSRRGNMPRCESCTECASFEFRPENVAPFYNIKAHFVQSQWNMPWSVYLVYRVLVASLLSGWIVGDFLDEASKFYSENYVLWLIFATNWSFILLWICSVFQAAIVAFHFNRAKQDPSYEAKLHDPSNTIDVAMMIFWVLYNCAFNGALLVSMSYWAYLVSSENAGFLVTRMSHMKHTLNGVYVLLDMSITAVPIRVFHVVYPLVCGVLYTVFNISYFANNGLAPGGKHYTYSVLDWQHPLRSAMTCGVAFVITTVIQGILYGFYRLRMYVCGHVMGDPYDVTTMEGGEALLPTPEDAGSESEVESILSPPEGGDSHANSGYDAMGESPHTRASGDHNACDSKTAETPLMEEPRNHNGS